MLIRLIVHPAMRKKAGATQNAIMIAGTTGAMLRSNAKPIAKGMKKAASMKINLRNMWSRLPLTRADVQTLHGTLRQMVRWKERG